jgi:DNA-binding NarL/FixJ family response regulator
LPVRTAVVVDQHRAGFAAVEEVLAKVSVEVVGTTCSLSEATRMIERLRPDLLILEIALTEGNMTGQAWLSRLSAGDKLKVIVLSASDDPAGIDAALASGVVAAYVVRKADPNELALAVRQVFARSLYLRRSQGPPAAHPERATEENGLTRREVEILRLAADGLANQEIARHLWVTEQTVKFHLSNVYRKLGISNRTEASRWAHMHGLLAGPPSGAAPKTS